MTTERMSVFQEYVLAHLLSCPHYWVKTFQTEWCSNCGALRNGSSITTTGIVKTFKALQAEAVSTPEPGATEP